MLNHALSEKDVDGDYVKTLLVPLPFFDLAEILWEANAKKHDIDGIYESIEAYGFIDPPKWEAALNNGKGGIVFGNGRTKALVAGLIEAKRQGLEPPRGIPVAKASGDWCIPVKFGVDQESEAQAIALGIDHNNLTMMGGDFSMLDIAGIWDTNGYADLLREAAEGGQSRCQSGRTLLMSFWLPLLGRKITSKKKIRTVLLN
jgi:hypothetical protein